MVIIYDPMWLPAEVVHIKGYPPSVQYVVDDGDNYSTILSQDRRVVRIVKQDDVPGRALCNDNRATGYLEYSHEAEVNLLDRLGVTKPPGPSGGMSACDDVLAAGVGNSK
ncbi:hypothetical protein [Saccharopolyspora sp. NPDC002376]